MNLAMFWAWIGWAGALAAETRPNVILVMADDLGYGDLSCYGQRFFETPHLDRLAREGIRFTDHYAGATVCAPSRSCLMTGRDTGHSGVRGNGPFALRPDPEDRTIASLLRESGYATALIGKSCVTGNTQTPATLAEKGFDYFFGTTSHKDGHFRYPNYEGGIRVPLVARWPNGIPAGQKTHQALYWEFHEMKGRRALRMGDWKLVQYGLQAGAHGKAELYDLSADLAETTNLAARHPQRVKEMLERMDASRSPSERFPLPGLDGLGN